MAFSAKQSVYVKRKCYTLQQWKNIFPLFFPSLNDVFGWFAVIERITRQMKNRPETLFLSGFFVKPTNGLEPLTC